MLSNDLLEDAVRFHGHLGPFLVLGLRAGLIATNYLGKSYFELKARVETAPHPPRSCFIDGIQFTSGCTFGKGNIEVKPSNNVSAIFVKGERRTRLVVQDAILRVLDEMASESQAEMLGKEIPQNTDDELFLIEVE